MFKIVTKKELNPTVTLMEIEAPLLQKRPSPVSLSSSELMGTAREFLLLLLTLTEREALSQLYSR